MAKNEPNKPDEVKTVPAQETTAEEKSTPAPMPEIGGESPAPVGYRLLPIRNATARENSSITGNGSVVISRSPFKRN